MGGIPKPWKLFETYPYLVITRYTHLILLRRLFSLVGN